MTRVLVCGSRNWESFSVIEEVLNRLTPTLIISGGARGADSLAQLYAQRHHIPFRLFLAKWGTYGKLAGAIRNQYMLSVSKPDIVVAFWDGKSFGTADMVRRAEKAGVSTHVISPSDGVIE